MTTRPCPVCGEPVAQRTSGRPAVYCGSECRREVERLRKYLPELEGQVHDAEQVATASERYRWPMAYAR